MKNEQELPIILTVDEEGRFKENVKKWKGMFVKEADPLIIDYLKEKGKLFKVEEYEHDYPFCWRCKTPLLYYAKKSWFIKMSKVKDRLIKNNQKINWIPSHFKEGRFGEWLREIKDWALSRERFWGTPLPLWQCKKCGYRTMIGSRKDLLEQKFSSNHYFILRHGDSLNVGKFYASYPEKKKTPLSKKGKIQIEKIACLLKRQKIDLIFSSDLLRTSQTAEIVGKILGIKPVYDKRLREIDAGAFNGKSLEEGLAYYGYKFKNPSSPELTCKKFEKPLPGGETYAEVRTRVLDFVRNLERKYQGKNILIVSHECPLTLLETAFLGMTIKETAHFRKNSKIKPGELRKVEFKDFPYNTNGELDFHRPYVDDIKFSCRKCAGIMERVPEVIDVWFDSGSMPFAQGHWPFAQRQKVEPPELFPADYICEGIDQTRGWFYTLLAISTLLGFGPPYKNVIALGHVLDEKGEKMSKSKGNVIDPWKAIKEFGADALRWYFYSLNQPEAPKKFNPKILTTLTNKLFLTLEHSHRFLTFYVKESLDISKLSPHHILDCWLVAKRKLLINQITQKLNDFQTLEASRLIEDFVNDLSNWYIRRSRSRFRQQSKDQHQAAAFLGQTLLLISRLTAPFTPFNSERLYRKLKKQLSGFKFKSSVHLENWPQPKELSSQEKTLLKKMTLIREATSLALSLRKRAKLRVRQPLAKLEIEIKHPLLSSKDKLLLGLLKEELNVKAVKLQKEIKERKGWMVAENKNLKVALDVKLTPLLKKEGALREIIRQIQFLRAVGDYRPEDKIIVYWQSESDKLKEVFDKFGKLLKQKANVQEVLNQIPKEGSLKKSSKVLGAKLTLGISKLARDK